MSDVEQNYFTCTLGHALQRKQQGVELETSVKTITDLIEDQAKKQPEAPALGFANFKTTDLSDDVPNNVSFRELRHLSISAASHLLSHVAPATEDASESYIALLCRSSMDFVMTWLGLMRLGYAVLLMAPQLEPPAIRHLCSSLSINIIFVDDTYADRTAEVKEQIKVVRVPRYWKDKPSTSLDPQRLSRPSETAFICHTSGTSSGLPKPIPQTQFGVVAALPRFSGQGKPATFSTTPLYHGGLADTCRAWTSGAMIWFFPEGLAPITGTTLVSALKFAQQHSTTPVKYFTSVPYILQLLGEEDEGVQLLQGMDLVGVGGAALPPSIGDKLVESGVNLLSRMGSAECGFLMSSHRDYRLDKDWQFLRPVNLPELVSFEPRDGGLSELIVQPKWPFLTKTNRDDGSYATADLFEPHSSIPNAWRYHSRADAQIALANGKKFDPSPMETSILAATSLLQDVLIFGAGRDYPGILLFPTTNELREDQVVDAVWPTIEEMNSSTQSHARLSKSMLVAVPVGNDAKPLEKSSKGTILRRQAQERYAEEIDSAYNSGSSVTRLQRSASFSQLVSAVQDCFARVLDREVDLERDLYQQGVDSISCVKIRRAIESVCVPEARRPLPLNVIYDQGTVSALCKYLQHLRGGSQAEDDNNDTSRGTLMDKLVQRYGSFADDTPRIYHKNKKVVVLTGATGLLGAHILLLLQNDPAVDKVYCLLRAKTPQEAAQRIRDALSMRGLPSANGDSKSNAKRCDVVCLPCNLSSEDLGLSQEHHDALIKEATVYIHAAWTVNFTLRLESFEDQIAGSRNLIECARKGGAKLLFISSTAAVSSCSGATIPECISNDPSAASPLGYSQSKWVTEQICDSANKSMDASRGTSEPEHGATVAIARVGQLCGNPMGVWNTSEAYPLMLSTASITGCLPDLPHEALDWLPVELAAEAVLDLSLAGKWPSDNSSAGRGTSTPVYHVLNPHKFPNWNDMLRWMKEEGDGPDFELVSRGQWVERLEDAVKTKAPNHPSQSLLAMWKQRYCEAPQGESLDGTSLSGPVFEVQRAQSASATMREVQPVTPERLTKIWRWVHQEIQGA
ncbi:Adenylate-forming reductase [Paramyrothecium foliicola]|nr:Adenylate-forming reductase [Paramyrothecium foliicola]